MSCNLIQYSARRPSHLVLVAAALSPESAELTAALCPLTRSQITSITGAAAVPIDLDASKYTGLKSAAFEPGHGLVTSRGPARIATGAGHWEHFATAPVVLPANALHISIVHAMVSRAGAVSFLNHPVRPSESG